MTGAESIKPGRPRSLAARILKHFSLWVLALVVVVLLVSGLLLNTQWGARFVLGQTDRFAPGEFRVGQVEGTLAGPLRLRQLSYEREGLAVAVHNLALDPAITDLLTGHLRVSDLDAGGVSVTLPPAGDEPPPKSPSLPPALNLPMSVALERTRIEDIRVQDAGGNPLLHLERLALDGELAAARLKLERLTVSHALGSVELTGNLDTGASYRADFDATLLWQREQGVVNARFNATGDASAFRVELEADAPVESVLDATLRDPFTGPALDFRLGLASLAPGALGLTGVPGPLTGELQGQADLESLQLSGWLAAGDDRVEIESLAARRDKGVLRLESLSLRGAGEARLQARGAVSFEDGAPALSLDADWQRVRVPLQGGRELSSEQGGIRVNGRPGDYRFAAELDLAGAVPAGSWRLEGSGSLERARIGILEGSILSGRLAGSGEVAWRPGVNWDLQLQGEGLDPAELAPRWPGSVSFSIDTRGELTDTGPAGRLRLQSLGGSLRQRPLEGSGDIRFQGLGRFSGNLSLTSGSSTVRAEGVYGPATDLALELDAASLADWYPGAEGSLRGLFDVTGSADSPRVAGDFSGNDVSLPGFDATTVNGDLDASIGASPSGRVTLGIGGASVYGWNVDTGRLALSGDREGHAVSLAASGPDGRLDAELRGAWQDEAWQGSLQELAVRTERLGRWQLDESPSLSAGAGRFALEPFCLRSDTGELCGRVQWQPESGLSAQARLASVPLAAATPALRHAAGRPLALDGLVDAEATIRMAPGGAPSVHLALDGRSAILAVPGVEQVTEFSLSPLRAEFHLDDGAMEGQGSVGLDRAGSVSAQWRSASFDPGAWQQAPIEGTVSLDIGDLSPLAPLAVAVTEPAGSLRGEFSLGGRLGALDLGGDVSLADFRVEIPRAGLALRDGRATISAANGGLRFEGRVDSGEGWLGLDGELAFGGGAGVSGSAAIRGESFLAVDRPGLEAVVSPELDIRLEGSRLEIDGETRVPRAVVDAGELEGGGVSASPDVVVAGRDGGEKEGGLDVVAEVDVILGEKIELRAPGFEGTASGRLHISERPGRPTLGRGELQVGGSYEAYGQSLTIRRGRLLFSNTPVDNPALDIRAVRVVDEVTAGVRIDGTARSPQLSLFSEPPLGSESEILSYLMLGRPLESATSGDGATLAGAAASLGLKGGDLLAKQIGARFGISDIGVSQSDELGQSALTLGKYLSPRLYISYGVGLAEPVSVIRLRYELTDHWALEAASGRETSGAIKFYYER